MSAHNVLSSPSLLTSSSSTLLRSTTSEAYFEHEHLGEYFGEEEEFEYLGETYRPDLDFLSVLVDVRLLKYVKWTEKECGWRLIREEAEEMKEEARLGTVIKKKFKESFAGEMLLHFNHQQPNDVNLQEKKLDIIRLALVQNEFPNTYERLNYYVDDIVKLLEECIKSNPGGVITLCSLLTKTPLLRLTNCQISSVDRSLSKFENLQALILASNYLRDFPGSYLPRNLKMLELYGNLLKKVSLLSDDPPPIILYLGIGRNYLNQNSGIINLLIFEHLCHLDLSDNDFVELDGLLETFSNFLRLESLELIGNPCSLSISYKRRVQSALPTLLYLDGEPLDDFQPYKSGKKGISFDNNACLQVYGYRFMGLQQNKDGKKMAQAWYRLELELPQLDSKLREFEEERILKGDMEDSVPELYFENPYPPPSNPTIELDKVSGRSAGNTKLSDKQLQKKVAEAKKKAKEQQIKAYQENYNKYLSGDKRYPVNTNFISQEIKWSKIMEFKNPCIEVPVPWHLLTKLRDTLRSIVTLRLVQVENKKHKPNKKEGKRQVETKNKKAEDKKEKPHDSKKVEQEENKNITIAKISVPLQILKWNEENMGYMWDIKRFCLARPFPKIQDVKYKAQDTKKKVGKKTKDKNRKSENANETEKPRDIPPYLTCHFAIGLKRELKVIDKKQGGKLSTIVKENKFGQKSKPYGKFRKRAQSLGKINRIEATLLTVIENLNNRNITYGKIKNEYQNLLTSSNIKSNAAKSNKNNVGITKNNKHDK